MNLYVIDTNLCSVCGLCADICEFEAISEIGRYQIDADKCTGCGLCRESCPSQAIVVKKDGAIAKQFMATSKRDMSD